jgi:hypothetical protein
MQTRHRSLANVLAEAIGVWQVEVLAVEVTAESAWPTLREATAARQRLP